MHTNELQQPFPCGISRGTLNYVLGLWLEGLRQEQDLLHESAIIAYQCALCHATLC